MQYLTPYLHTCCTYVYRSTGKDRLYGIATRATVRASQRLAYQYGRYLLPRAPSRECQSRLNFLSWSSSVGSLQRWIPGPPLGALPRWDWRLRSSALPFTPSQLGEGL